MSSGLYSLAQFPSDALQGLLRRSIELFNDETAHSRPLTDAVIGLLFLRTSTRTRTAFSAGALRLGAQLISYGPSDLQLNTGETAADTGKMFSSMLDQLVVRTAEPEQQLRDLSDSGKLSVINAMCAEEHPTQAISDLASMQRHLGDLRGVRVMYVGEGNNTAVALAHGIARIPQAVGMFFTPQGYGLPSRVVHDANKVAQSVAGRVTHCEGSLDDLPSEVDVIYTTRWQTTGTSKGTADWREQFRPYYVDEGFIAKWPEAIVMHDLPAHRGEEISSGVLEGERCIAWAQGAMKMRSAMAVLEWAAANGQ